MARTPWTLEEELEVIDLKRKGVSTREIIGVLEKLYGSQRKAGSVDSHTSKLKKDHGAQDLDDLYETLAQNTSESAQDLPETSSIEIVPASSSLTEALATYDDKFTRNILAERERLVYRMLGEQAQTIRNYDLFKGFEGMTSEELMDLDESDRNNFIQLLQELSGQERYLPNSITLIQYASSSQDPHRSSFVLPLFDEDISEKSDKSIRSLLYDMITTGLELSDYHPIEGRVERDSQQGLIRLHRRHEGEQHDLATLVSNINDLRSSPLEETQVIIHSDLPLYSNIFDKYKE